LSFWVFHVHQHGGHTLHNCFLSPLSPSARDGERGYLSLPGGKILMHWWPLYGHDSHNCYLAPALGRDGPDIVASGGCRGHTSRCSLVAQQPTVGTRLPISHRAVAPRCSSSRPSTPRIMKKGGRSRRQRIRAPPRLRAQRHLLMCLIRRMYCRALRRPTSVMSSSAAAGARIVASPLSATVKGAAILRAATLREILNLLRQHERCPRRVPCDALALQRALGGVWHLYRISGWWSDPTEFLHIYSTSILAT
jgi:hypothetical protein